MALPFRRSGGAGGLDEGMPVCMAPSPEQRRWEVAALLSSLSPEVREALHGWLLAPTDYQRWQPPATFGKERHPIGWREGQGLTWGKGVALLYEELRVIRQTLDFPPQAVSGLTRNGLLTVHAMRLRQLERWLWPKAVAKAIREMIA